jgi:hypothetical protein
MVPGRLRLAGLLTLLLLQAAPAGQAPAAGTTDGGAVPQVTLSIQAISPAGPFGGETEVKWTLSRDHTAQMRVGGGSKDFPNLCALSSGNLPFDPGTQVGWVLEARLLEAHASGARVHVRWTRRVMEPGVIADGDMQREHEVSLGEGQRLVIDLVRLAGQESSGCDGVVIRLGLEYADPPELASELFDYDIWLVHRTPDGHETVDRASGRALHGKDLEYLFRPTRYDRQGSPQISGDVELRVSGRVKARLRRDGQIDLSVGAERIVAYKRLGSGEHGTKQAVVADGDTLEVELPPHQSSQRYSLSQRTSVRVTVRRIH